ncbi:MAG: hypothetical protein WCO60_01555 [Verrucomicrobiota bacterium]
MSQQSHSLDRINALKAEIAALEQSAVGELQNRRLALIAEIERIDTEIENLSGKSVKKSKLRVRTGRSLPLQELKELLENAPEKTLNVRKEKLDFANIKTLANANPHLLKIAGKGPWPTVTLLK